MTTSVPGSADIERRVTVLEGEVAHLREQVALTASNAAAARELASGADRDVSDVRSELRAHTRALNALRETQLEMGVQLMAFRESVDLRFARVDENFARVDENFAQVQGQFASVGTGMRQITEMLQELIDRQGPSGAG